MPNAPLSPLENVLSQAKGLPEFQFDKVERVERAPSAPSGGSVPSDLMPVFEDAASQYNVPVNVLLGLAEQESGFNPRAVGQQTKWGTAKGIMQYLDSTARGMGINAYDPVQSVGAAAKQLRERLDKGYSMEDAVKEHFAGPDRAQWGPKTAQYGIDVMRRAQRFLGGYEPGEATPQVSGQPAPSPLTIENQNARNAEAAAQMLEEMNRDEPGRYAVPTPEQLAAAQGSSAPAAMPQIAPQDTPEDGFFSATGKAVGNIPENFQNAAGGLIRYLGEDMSAAKEKSLERVAGQLGIDLEEAKLVYWAETNNLIDDDLKQKSTREMVDELKARHMAEGNPEAAAQVEQAAQQAFSNGGLFSPEALAAAGRGVSKSAKDSMTEINPDGPLAKYGSMIIGSTAEMVPALLAGMVTRNPNVTLGMIGGQVYGQSYDRAREAGENALEPQEAARYALAQAAAEAIPSALPIGVILKPGGNLFKGLVKAGAAEALQEGVTSILQTGIDKGTIDPDMTWGEASQQLMDSMIVGAGAGVGMKGTVDATGKAADLAGKAVYEARGGDAGALAREMSAAVDQTTFDAPAEALAVQALNPNAEAITERARVASSGPLGRALSQSIPINPVVDEPELAPEQPAVPAEAEIPAEAELPVEADIPADAEPAKEGQRVVLTAEGIDPITGEIIGQSEESVIIKADDGSTYDVPASEIQSGNVVVTAETAPDAAAEPESKPEPEPTKDSAPEPTPEPKSYDQMDEPELRQRMKYLAQMAKANGWDKRLTGERKKVEAAIDALKAAEAPAEKVEAPAEEPKAQDVKWFGTQEKADNFIAKKGLGESHEVVQEGRRFEIRPRAEAPKVETPAEEPKVKGHVNRAKKLIGADVGDTITMSGDVGYASGNTPYKVESIDKKGSVYVRDPATGSGTVLSRAELERAKNGGVTFAKGVADSETTAPASKQSVEGKDLGDGWAEFTPESGTLRIPRADMPQIKAEHRGAMVNFLEARGITHGEAETVPADSLKPTQAEFSRDKVAKAKSFEGGDRSILVSSDGHVLDGHHQWLAKREAGEDVKVIRLGAPIEQLLSEVAEFPSASVDTEQPGESIPEKAMRLQKERNAQRKAAAKVTEPQIVDNDSELIEQTRANMAGEAPERAALIALRDMIEIGTDTMNDGQLPGAISQQALALNSRIEEGLESGDIADVQTEAAGLIGEWLKRDDLGEGRAELQSMLRVIERQAQVAAPEGKRISDNKIFTEDAAEKARQLLRSKLGQLNTGIDPEIMQAGITLAGYHIEKGARTFAAYAKAMTDDLGEIVKPYLKSWYMGVKYDPRAAGFDGMSSAAEVEAFEFDAPAEGKPLVDALYDRLKAGNLPKDNNGLRKLVSDIDGQQADNARLKQAQEDLEAAMARYARDIVAQGKSDAETFNALVELYNDQPNLNIRTSSSVENQAYSTPAPLAFAAARLAGIDVSVKVYEPTAGNGMLLMTANPKKATANELDGQRYQNLVDQGFDAIQGDAMQAIESGIVTPKSQDAVITNPPFGSVKGDDGKATKVPVDGYKLGKIDHLIAAEALKSLKDGGKATLIIGADKKPGGLSTDDRIFFNWLYSNYNVTGQFEVDGKLYNRQGAGWPVRVITINGRAKSDSVSPPAGTIQRVNSWSEVYEQFEQGLGAQNGTAKSDAAAGREPAGKAADDGAAAPRADARKADAPVQGSRKGSDAPAGNVSGAAARADRDQADGAGKQLADGAAEQRPDERANAQDQLEPGDDRGTGTSGRDQKRAEKPDAAKPAGNALASAENAFQTAYTPRSSRKDEGVLVPINMAQSLQDSLSTLEDAVGDIDQYAAKELGYPDVESLHDALMGLQVDSVASAIYQIKERQKGVIVADQTGIGKGRQAAAIIRWAARNNRVPVFVTVKPALFTDMYNDLADIGSRDIEPLLMNSAEWIASPSGDKLFTNKPSQHRKVLEGIAMTGELPEGRNALFLTYSQINTDNVQRRALSALANRAVFVLDESHNAGGESSTGKFMREALENVEGVTYLSATFAKRADNMPLYFKTDIGNAINDSDGLMDAMARGGLPLQTVVSNNLVKAGQMFRRERSYDGVSVTTRVDTDNRAEHEKLSDAVTSALRGIVAADRTFHNGYVERLKEELEAKGEAIQDIAGNQASESVNHTQFSSVVHNFVRQMLLGLQADTAAQQAIDTLKRGEKPLIALENTMGSFLNEYAANNDLKTGDRLGNFDYRTVLSRALERTRYVVRVLPNGEKEKQYIPLSKLDTQTREAYEEAQSTIDGLDMDIPVQPLDWIRHRLQQAGYSVAEITGRKLSVDYAGKTPTLSQIPTEEQTDKVSTTRRFNDGSLDAVILNVAGSTGISLHASEKFKDQRKRHMIIAQPAQDINIFMQMLGRVHRTGQVTLPGYTILNVDLPAQKRPTALLNKKMKSLNANTSSNTESATSIDSADMLNKYGDQVIANYLSDNPLMAEELDVSPDSSDADGNPTEDIARKVTGRMALMPVKVQKEFYAEVEEQYAALMNYLNETNQNDLEPRTYDYEAELVEDRVLVEATDPTSPFGDEAVYGEYKIKAQGKQMTPDEIRADMESSLDGKTPTEHVKQMGQDAIKAYWEGYNSQIEAGRIEGEPVDVAAKVEAMSVEGDTANIGYSFMRGHRIGSTWRVEINGDIYNGVVTNLRNTHKANGNPFSLSKIQVTLAVNGPLRSITVPASQWGKIEVAPLTGTSIDNLMSEKVAGSEKAKIVTGNLLAAYGELVGAKGTIISFTKADGSIEQGILLPKTFSIQLNTRGDQQMRDPGEVLKVLRGATDKDFKKFGVTSRDGAVRVTADGDGIRITVPKSKRRGGKYFLDRRLTDITGDFVSDGDGMVVTVSAKKAPEALRYLMTKAPLYASSMFADEARSILGLPPREKPKASVPSKPARGTVSAGDVERSLRNSDLGKEIGSLIDSGKLVIHKGQIPGATAKVAGLYRDGVMHLSADQLRPATALPVMLHEMFHAGARPLVGEKAWSGLMGRLHSLRMQAKASGGKAKEIHQAANRRIEAAERAGVKMTEAIRDEEFGAYMVENYERMPRAFKKWIDDAIGAIKAFMLRRFDLQLGDVTPAQLSALAKAAIRSEVRTETAEVLASQPAPQVDTPEFARWFGESKVVDADGNPLVVYHGSPDLRFIGEEGTFKTEAERYGMGRRTGAHWFAASESVAKSYADPRRAFDYQRAEEGVISAYLKIENPFVVNGKGQKWRDAQRSGKTTDLIAEARSNGHDGVIIKNVRDNYQTGVVGGDRATDTYVVWESSQIKSATENSGNFDPESPDIRASVDAPTEKEVDGWFSRKLTDAMAGPKSSGQYSLLALAPMDRMIDEMTGDNSGARQYLNLKRDMDAYRTKKHTQFDETAQKWLKMNALDRESGRELAGIMHDATIAQLDPAKPFVQRLTPKEREIAFRDGPSHPRYEEVREKMERDDRDVIVYRELKNRFDKLPAQFKSMYREVRDTYKAMTDELDQILVDNLSAAIDIHGRKAERAYEKDMADIRDEGLTGDAKKEAEAKAERKYKTATTKLQWNKRARITQLRQQFESNRLQGPYFPLARFGSLFVTVRDRDTGEVISFSRFENSTEQQRFAKQAARLGDVTTGTLSNEADLKGTVDPRFVSDIEDILGGADVPDSVKDQVWQRYLESMPDMSMRKGFIHRKNRAGFTQDALRAFASSMFHNAHQMGRLKYGAQMQEAIEMGTEYARKTDTPERDTAVVNEIARRHGYVMNPKGGAFAQHLTSAAFIYQLSMSPAAALVNLSQTVILGVPIIGAKYGVAKTSAQLMRATKDFTAGRGRADRSKALSEPERSAMKAAYESGLVESTNSHNLAGVGETGVQYSAVRNKVMGVLAFMFHQAERFNREVTFLTAYRLAKADGLSQEQAIQEAINLTYKVHFDYGNTNRPRAMHGDTAKVALVFRNYQINMLYRLFRDAHQAVKGETKAVRKEAARQLGGITGMMALHAGVRGVWGYGIAMMLASLFFGDDAEEEFKKGTVELLGPTAAGMLLNGVPGHAMKLNLTGRIGMPDLWFRSPNRQLEGRDEFNYWQSQLLGFMPVIAENLFRGINLIGEGKAYRGVETAAPKFVKDLMRAARMANEGATNLRGDALVESLTPGELTAQAMGFTPAVVAEQYDRNNALINAEKRIMSERRRLMDRYAVAHKQGDAEEMREVRREMQAFNKENREVAITPQTINRSLRARQRYSGRTDGGVTLNPNLDRRLRGNIGEPIYK